MSSVANQPSPRRVGRLRGGVLGAKDAFAASFALLALAMGSSVATSSVAGTAGAAAPLAYLLAGAGSLCLASVIVRFTRRMASAGGLYTYISRGLDARTGFIGGWLYSMAFAAGVSFVMIISAVFLSQIFTVHAHVNIGWFPLFFIEMAVLLVVALVDIRISTRAQLIAAALGTLAIVVAMVVTDVKGGAGGVSLQPFNPDHVPGLHDYFLGMVFAFTGFIGFEAAAALGEETKNPLRVIPRAALTAVIVAVVFYVFVAFSMSIGFGIGNAGKWAQDPTALDTITTRYAGSALAVIVDAGVVIDAFVAALAGILLVSRTLYAMGRDGGLPRAFAWTHPRFRTPWLGIITPVVLTLVLVIWLARLTYDNPLVYFGFMATTATFGILATYILISVAGIVYFWREKRAGGVRYNPLLDLLLPLGAIVICGLTIYYSIEPVPPAPIKWAPWIALGWLCLGLATLAWLSINHLEKVRSFGRILGEEKPSEAAPTRDDQMIAPLS